MNLIIQNRFYFFKERSLSYCLYLFLILNQQSFCSYKKCLILIYNYGDLISILPYVYLFPLAKNMYAFFLYLILNLFIIEKSQGQSILYFEANKPIILQLHALLFKFIQQPVYFFLQPNLLFKVFFLILIHLARYECP